MLLDASWSLHNVIAWIKVTPFLPRRGSQLFIGTLILAQPFWILEIYANFAYFHGVSDLFLNTRPWEALCRDPWWLFAAGVLFWKIKTQYDMSFKEIVGISPRFGIMMLAAFLSVVFFILDIVSATNTLNLGLPSGINPFWKVSSVFKCLMDCVILDDFKTAMDRLRAYKISHIGSFSQDNPAQTDGGLVRRWEEIEVNEQHNSRAMECGGGAWADLQRPANLVPSMRCPEHRRPSQLRRGMSWSPRFEGQHLEDGTFSGFHDLEEIVPSALGDGLVKRVEPSMIR
ncbi:hypothetical protein PMIN03_011892 [Paraphaeosphaeria minitans]